MQALKSSVASSKLVSGTQILLNSSLIWALGCLGFPKNVIWEFPALQRYLLWHLLWAHTTSHHFLGHSCHSKCNSFFRTRLPLATCPPGYFSLVRSSLPDRAPSVAASYSRVCLTPSARAKFWCLLSVVICISHEDHPTEPCYLYFLTEQPSKPEHLFGRARLFVNCSECLLRASGGFLAMWLPCRDAQLAPIDSAPSQDLVNTETIKYLHKKIDFWSAEVLAGHRAQLRSHDQLQGKQHA